MKISIIIPVYNVEDYIERCFESVKNQSYSSIECIFVDDCSPDNSIQILQKLIATYIGKIEFQLVSHKINKGLSEARNTGTEYAKGEYIYYLDSDDEITSNCIEELYKLVRKYPKIDVVQGNTQTIPQPNRNNDWRNISLKDFPEYVNNSSWIKQRCFKHPKIPVNAWNKLVRKDFILDNSLFFRPGIIHEDVHWMFYVTKHIHSIAFTETYSYIHYIVPNSIMRSNNRKKSLRSWVFILGDFLDNIEKPYNSLEKRFVYSKLCHLILSLSNVHEYDEFIVAYGHIVKKQIIISLRKLKMPELFMQMIFLIPPKLFVKTRFTRKLFKYFIYFFLRMI
nr:glycosyltransferase family 2 protein [uncultured Draconibacterium sp.]